MPNPYVSTPRAFTFRSYGIPIFVVIMTTNPYAAHNTMLTKRFYYFRYIQIGTLAFWTLC